MEDSNLIDLFVLSSEECELLLAFETTGSLQSVAGKMRRDHSVISRQLKKISEKMPVVEKKAGKWVLTSTGKELNQLTRSVIAAQANLNRSQQFLRLGSNREFASLIIGPDFKKIIELFPRCHITLQTFEQGTENALLNSLIDISLDCDRPFDPDISFKLLIDEPIIAVCSKSFAIKNKKVIENGEYQKLPHLLCDRLHPDKILFKTENQLQSIARFNDIAVARSVCLQGIGWALLPQYAVKEELEAKSLIQIDKNNYGKSKYGIWWLRNRPYLAESVRLLSEWLKQKKL